MAVETPPHNNRVPALPEISHDVASPRMCWPAVAHRQSWKSTRLQGDYPVAAPIHTPRFIAPHRGAAHTERQGQAQSSLRGRPLSQRRGRPLIGTWSREAATPFSHRPDRPEARLHLAERMLRRRQSVVGGSAYREDSRCRCPRLRPLLSRRNARRSLPPSAPQPSARPRWLRSYTVAGGLPPAGSAAAQFPCRPGYAGRRG
jgi:hypothetical protein